MRKNSGIIWEKADDIKKRVGYLIQTLSLDWITQSQVYFFRSYNSSSRSYARIWGLSRIWQLALGLKPSYIIEVISERFDKLDEEKQDEILLHELAHIPKNFSGSLLPHIRRGKRSFKDRVEKLYSSYRRKSSSQKL